ncbi:MAG TPA: RagB/SusD family nutrient uptake outer membrane protein [Pseudosphingobacterium sp.]|nr:RagB/SusD family nutrient uptake outer membrane protein [Pseudosphingobacterium sp.]
MENKKYRILILALIGLFSSCSKDWLEKKPDISLVVPKSLGDLQALMDNTFQAFNFGGCVLGEVASDNYYVTPEVYQSMSLLERNAYAWSTEIYTSNYDVFEWQIGYTQIYYTNVVLETLKELNPQKDITLYNNVLGSALFYRSFAYYDMVQVYAKGYDEHTANTDLGLPIKVSSNINELSARSTIAETYKRIIEDTKQASQSLPLVQDYKTRPSKPAAFALLARTYLAMEQYQEAYLYADSCLQLYSKLLQFKDLDLNSSTPIPRFNDEILFASTMASLNTLFIGSSAKIDSGLYNSYEPRDLRKSVFFKIGISGLPELFGRYSADDYVLFNGLAVDEIYLIRAEAACRTGQYAKGMEDLNTLLKTRWDKGFIELTADNQEEALLKILAERRKELCFRGLRWSDLKRLNKDERFKKTLVRMVNGTEYTLPPNDNRYVYPIPPLETNLNPSIVQNPRN